MERLRLDYQRRDLALPRLGVALLVAAVLVVVAGGGYYADLRGRLAAWQANGEQMEKAARQRGMLLQPDGRSDAADGERIRRANVVLRQLTLPWQPLFDTIEAAASKDVALLLLAPDAERHLVKIGIEAKNAQAGLDYVRRLEEQAVFQEVQVRNHQVQTQDPERPVRFGLEATWKESP